MLEQLLENAGSGQKVVFMYDIACQLENYLKVSHVYICS